MSAMHVHHLLRLTCPNAHAQGDLVGDQCCWTGCGTSALQHQRVTAWLPVIKGSAGCRTACSFCTGRQVKVPDSPQMLLLQLMVELVLGWWEPP
jgi:hypothetical protein